MLLPSLTCKTRSRIIFFFHIFKIILFVLKCIQQLFAIISWQGKVETMEKKKYDNNILYFEKPMSKCGLTEAGSLCQK